MPKYFPHYTVHGYAILFVIGFILGMIETFFLSKIPEPQMPPLEHRSFFKTLYQPFKDSNFRQLLSFLGSWNFSINLAVPFFTVYMLKRLELGMSLVIGLTITTQVVNVFIFRAWGRFSDHFSNKSVLAVSGPMYIFCILVWTFTTMPEKYFLTFPLLIIIHLLMGIATAGVNLASGNIGLKLAPKGQATAYLAVINLVNSIAAGIAPALGGKFADFFVERSLSWTLTWRSPDKEMVFQTLDFRHWDFFFFLAFVVGIYSLHRLSFIKEEGEVEESIVIDELLSEITKPFSVFSRLTGMYKVAGVTSKITGRLFNGNQNKFKK